MVISRMETGSICCCKICIIHSQKNEDAFTDQNASKEVSRHYASSDKMISQNDSYVNKTIVQKKN